MTVRPTPPAHRSVLGYHDIPWAGACPNLDLWLPKWVRWQIRCTAHRSSDGQRCRAWAIHGGYVCSAHGGRARQVRLAAQRRLALAAWERGYVRLVRQVLAEREARRAA